MREKQLSPRLAKIVELVRQGTTVCDIGTDHAFIPVFLANKGLNKKIYASDINSKPLEFACREVKRKNAAVTLLLSDGLESIPPCDDVIIAGMGGELIAEIVENMPEEFKTENLRLILQPMTKQEILRKRLNVAGFEIIFEEKVKEKKPVKRSAMLTVTSFREYVIFYVKTI
jgi:tRNA (adenine22-N1)-methyltransferase